MGFFVYSQACATITTVIPEHFHPSKRNLISINSRSPFAPPTSLSTTNLLSLSTHSCKRIVQHVVFGGWLRSLSIMLSRFIHVAVWLSLLFFLYSIVCIYHISGYWFISWYTFGLFPPAVMNNDILNFYVQVLHQTYIFISLGYTAMSGIAGSCGNSV